MGNQLTYGATRPPMPTLGELRSACQFSGPGSEKAKQYQAAMVANALNSYGYRVEFYDAKTKKTLPAPEICRNIKHIIPNAESVCMVSSTKDATQQRKAIFALAEALNAMGANIMLKKDPFGDDSERNMRAPHDVCNDIYMVNDRLYRQLSKESDLYKANLAKAITQLGLQRDALRQETAKLLGWVGNASNLDKMGTDAKSAQTLVNGVTAEIESELAKSLTRYQELQDYHKAKVEPRLQLIGKQLNSYKTGFFGAPSSSDIDQNIGRLFISLEAAQSLAKKATSCLTKIGVNQAVVNLVGDASIAPNDKLARLEEIIAAADKSKLDPSSTEGAECIRILTDKKKLLADLMASNATTASSLPGLVSPVMAGGMAGRIEGFLHN